jgi:hypothetical protein
MQQVQPPHSSGPDGFLLSAAGLLLLLFFFQPMASSLR